MIEKEGIKLNNGRELIDLLINSSIQNHPFFKDSDNWDIAYISLILENGRNLDITRFLARLIYKADDFRIRAKLVPQLFDELGAGKFEKIHVNLIVKLLTAVKPYAQISAEDKEIIDDAYESLDKTYSELFNTDNLYKGIGVAIANEIIVQPIFEYFQKVVDASNVEFNPSDLEWLNAHDELEEDHVQDSIDLAILLNEAQLEDALQGAVLLHNGIWEFFNELMKISINK